jgi:hypothetical protein
MQKCKDLANMEQHLRENYWKWRNGAANSKVSPIWIWSKTSSFYWDHMSRFHLKMEIESSPQNVF